MQITLKAVSNIHSWATDNCFLSNGLMFQIVSSRDVKQSLMFNQLMPSVVFLVLKYECESKNQNGEEPCHDLMIKAEDKQPWGHRFESRLFKLEKIQVTKWGRYSMSINLFVKNSLGFPKKWWYVKIPTSVPRTVSGWALKPRSLGDGKEVC